MEDELAELARESQSPKQGGPLATRVRLLARPLIERRKLDPLIVAARCWRYLSRQARADLLGLGLSAWRRPLTDIGADRDPRVRANAARIIAEARAYRFAPDLLRLIGDRDADVAHVADLALLRMAAELQDVDLAGSDRRTHPSIDPESRWLIERVVADAVRDSATHRRRGVLLAGVLLLDDAAMARARAQGHGASPLRSALTDATESSQMMLRSVIRRSREPMVRARALSWLAAGPAIAASLDRVALAYSLADHEAVLRRVHLLTRASRARRVGLIECVARTGAALLRDDDDRPDGAVTWPARAPVPPPEVVEHLSPDARAGLPRWCAALRMGAFEKGLVLGQLLADPNPAARHAVVRFGPRRLVADLAYDADARVATAAARRWSLVGERTAPARVDDARFLERLARSPHTGIRRIVSEEIERRYAWNPRSPVSRLAARRALAADRSHVIDQLRRRLTDAPAPARIDAIVLARTLNVIPDVEIELLRMAAGEVTGLEPDDRWRVVATSVAALAFVGSPASFDALLACLDHSIDRVRANAVEAAARAARLRHVGIDRMAELKADEHHRVRANALRELLKGDGALIVPDPEAAQNVVDMLADARPMHRVAGLWLTERLLPVGVNPSLSKRWTELSVRVAELAKGDDDERVRTRGARCARRLLVQMRSGWRSRAMPLETTIHARGAA
jgi:hypothetical protein